MRRHIKRCLVSKHYLIEKEFSALLFPKVHLLHSHQFPRGLDCGDTHDSSGTLSYFNVVVQIGSWITRIHHHLKCRSELLMRNSLGLSLWWPALGWSARWGAPRWHRGTWGWNVGVRCVWMMGAVGGQAWLWSMMSMRVAKRRLGGGRPSRGAAWGAILRGGFLVSNILEETVIGINTFKDLNIKYIIYT